MGGMGIGVCPLDLRNPIDLDKVFQGKGWTKERGVGGPELKKGETGVVKIHTCQPLRNSLIGGVAREVRLKQGRPKSKQSPNPVSLALAPLSNERPGWPGGARNRWRGRGRETTGAIRIIHYLFIYSLHVFIYSLVRSCLPVFIRAGI